MEPQNLPPIYVHDSGHEYSALSPTFACHFRQGKTWFMCSEQYFQASKAEHFRDDETLRRIRGAIDSKEHRRLGSLVKPSANEDSVPDWLVGSDKNRFSETAKHSFELQRVYWGSAFYRQFSTSMYRRIQQALLLTTGERKIIYVPDSDARLALGFGPKDGKLEPELGTWNDYSMVGEALESVRSDFKRKSINEIRTPRQAEEYLKQYRKQAPNWVEEMQYMSHYVKKRKADPEKLQQDDERADKRAKLQ